MAENLEKQSFTFFAFLPPYIGVSGSLVSRNGNNNIPQAIVTFHKQ